MIDQDRLKQIKDMLRLTGQDDSLINEAMNISGPDDFLPLLYKLRDSLSESIRLIEEQERKNESSA